MEIEKLDFRFDSSIKNHVGKLVLESQVEQSILKTCRWKKVAQINFRRINFRYRVACEWTEIIDFYCILLYFMK